MSARQSNRAQLVSVRDGVAAGDQHPPGLRRRVHECGEDLGEAGVGERAGVGGEVLLEVVEQHHQPVLAAAAARTSRSLPAIVDLRGAAQGGAAGVPASVGDGVGDGGEQGGRVPGADVLGDRPAVGAQAGRGAGRRARSSRCRRPRSARPRPTRRRFAVALVAAQRRDRVSRSRATAADQLARAAVPAPPVGCGGSVAGRVAQRGGPRSRRGSVGAGGEQGRRRRTPGRGSAGLRAPAGGDDCSTARRASASAAATVRVGVVASSR